MKPSKATLARMKEKVYLNAVRLFCDACVLFRVRSYPSAHALAILSFEELGKLEMIDHICDDIQLGWDHKEMVKMLFSRNMFFSHKNKQAWAENDGWFSIKDTKRKKHVEAGLLEQHKQDSFYVGYVNGRIKDPSRISKTKAYNEIVRVMNKFETVDDLGFNGFDCLPTAISRTMSRWQIAKIKKHFTSINNNRRKLTNTYTRSLRSG